MFIRTIETCKDLFKHGNKYIKAKDVFMYISIKGIDVQFLYKKNGLMYNLKDEKVDFNREKYFDLNTIGRFGAGIKEDIVWFVKLDDEDSKKIASFLKYIQKGFKYGDYLPIGTLELISGIQNYNHVMPWHKYDKDILLDIQKELNRMLTYNPPTSFSYRSHLGELNKKKFKSNTRELQEISLTQNAEQSNDKKEKEDDELEM